MPSPTCEVKDGSGSYSATDGGVDVTPANTITIRLVSQSGVDTWSIACISTDDLSDADAVTAALTIDALNKTATFTAPVAGRAYLFRSTVNGGVDKNGRSQSSYTTTFGVYTLTAGSDRVHALDETTEAGEFGWAATINELIRNGGGGGGGDLPEPGAGDAGKVVTVNGTEDGYELTSPGGGAGTTPTGTGFTHITGGVQDAAAKLVVNADVDAAAAIAASKVVQATGTGFPHVTAGVLDAASKRVDTTNSADVTVPATGVVKSNGSVLSSGTVSLATEVSGTLPLGNQAAPTGTGFATVTSGAWDAAASAFPATVPMGGTGATTLTADEIVIGAGASALSTATGVKAGNKFISIRGAASANVASTGLFRVGPSFDLFGLDSGETNNLRVLSLSSGALQIGGGTTEPTALVLSTSGGISLRGGSAEKAAVDSNGFRLNDGSSHYLTFTMPTLAASRTLNMPLLTATDTMAVLDLAQTFTNKTLTTPTINGATISGTFAGNATCSGTITFSGVAKFGASPYSSTGTIQLANVVSAKYRNAGNSGDETLWFCSGNSISLGDTDVTGVTYVQNNGTGVVYKGPAHYFQTAGGTDIINWSSSTITNKTTAIASDGNARAKAYSNIANVQTTDATVTSLYTWTILDEAQTLCTAEVTTCISTGASGASYVRRVKIKRDGGTVTMGTVEDSYTVEDDAAWDCTIDNSTSTGRVRVTGKASNTLDWGGIITRLEVSHA